MLQEWRPVPGYEGAYEVSDQGNVRSLDRVSKNGRHLSGKMLKQSQGGSNANYRQVALFQDGNVKRPLVSRLVLEAFVGPSPEGYQACHNDGNTRDNRLENLRWDSSSGNNLDKVRHGTHPEANKTHCPRGHQYVEKNIWPSGIKRGMRDCKACGRVRNRVRKGAIPMEIFQEEADREFAEIIKEGSRFLL